MRGNLILIISYFLLFGLINSKASTIEVIYKNHLPEIEGESILTVYRDSKGFLWIGTYKGLIKYDGTVHVKYLLDAADEQSISSSTVYSIYEDSKNRLWFGTQNGLNQYHYSTNNFSRFLNESEHPQNFKEIRDITEDDKGNLWLVCYNNKGLIKYNPETNHDNTYKIPDVSDLRLNTIEYANNNLWIGAELNGLFCFDLDKNKITNPIIYDENGTLITINDIKILNNTLWIGTWYNGLVQYNLTSKEIIWHNGPNSKNKIPESNNVRQIAIDSENNLWLAIFGGGITKYEPKTNEFIDIRSKFDYSTSSEILSSWTIHIDQQNVIWLGLFDNGLKSLYMNSIQSDFLTFINQNGIHNINYINQAVQDSSQNIWIATRTQGLIKYNIQSKKGQQILLNSKPEIKTVEIDKMKRIWASTENGIFVINPSNNEILVNLAETHPFINNTIKTPYLIYSDNDGDIWLAAWQTGLIRITYDQIKGDLKKLRYEHYRFDSTANHGLFNNTLINVYQSSKGLVLVSGTYFIQKFNKASKEFELFEWVDGEDISDDCNNHLWIFSNSKGIIDYDLKTKEYRSMEIEDQTYSKIAGIFKHNCYVFFTRINDLIELNSAENEFSSININAGIKNIHHNNSCFTLNDSTIFMGGEEGCYLLNPSKSQTTSNDVRISNLFIYNKPVNPHDVINNKTVLEKDIGNLPDITIPPNIQSFSLELSSINFNNIKNVVYAYKLIGFDTTWHYLRYPNRAAVFNNLNGGNYKFKFAIYNPFSEWENTAKSVKIKILIPYYKTKWFKALVILVILSLIFLYFFSRQRRLTKLNKELEVIIDNRTQQLKLSNTQLKEMNIAKDKFFSIIAHDLRSPLGSIRGLLHLLNKDFDKFDVQKKKNQIKLASESSETVLNLVENLLLWSRAISHKIEFNPQECEINTLINENIKLAHLNAREKNIEISFLPSSNNILFKLDRNMFKFVIRNLLLNAVKFTHNNGKIEVLLSQSKQGIKISVVDSGIGISEKNLQNIFKIDKQFTSTGTNNEKGTGLGLILCKDFIEKHGGKIWIDSTVNIGSTFYFSLPN